MMELKKHILWIAWGISCGKTTFCKRFSKYLKLLNIPHQIIQVDNIRRNILYKSKEESHYKVRTALKKSLNIAHSEYNFFDQSTFWKNIFSSKKKMEIYKEFINPEIILCIKNIIEKANWIILIEWAMFVEDWMLALTNNNIILFEENEDLQYSRLKNWWLSDYEIIKRIKFTKWLGVKKRIKTVQKIINEKWYWNLVLIKPNITKSETQEKIKFILSQYNYENI